MSNIEHVKAIPESCGRITREAESVGCKYNQENALPWTPREEEVS